MNKISLFIHTIKYLKLSQILWRVYYTLKKKAKLNTRVSLSRYETVDFVGIRVKFIKRKLSYISNNEFIFLNQKRRVINWNDNRIEKLWLYNLHYFDFLLQESPPNSALIDKWIDENAIGKSNGWEPYPLSLRTINWLKYHIEVKPLNSKQLDSLHSQAQFLSKNIEYHILGNHIFENAKSLFILGIFFKNKSFLSKGLKLLNKEINEQILDDGAHFELSTMYHAIMLEGMLDIINFCRIFNYNYPREWDSKVELMISFYLGLLHPDEKISFFNDSTFGIASSSPDLLNYAKELGFEINERTIKKFYKNSGFVRFNNYDIFVIFKVGEIGASYIPGHAHADLLSFEMSYLEQRVFVNTGISTYEIGERRTLERSTKAHNTVEINGKNQSEVWSSFRVGNRVYPQNIEVDNDKIFARGSYTGTDHTRHIQLTNKGTLEIEDTFGGNIESIKSYFHLHPNIEITKNGINEFLLSLNSGRKLVCKVLGPVDIKIEKYLWAEGFNRLVESQRIICSGFNINKINVKVFAV